MERKDFIQGIAVCVAAGTLTSFLASCQKNNNTPSAPVVDFTLDMNASPNTALLSSGGAVVSNQVMIINNSGSYVALSDICTHQGCSLGYASSSQQLQCGCHGGTFSLDGSVIAGPPPSSLKKYTVSRNGNILHVSG